MKTTLTQERPWCQTEAKSVKKKSGILHGYAIP